MTTVDRSKFIGSSDAAVVLGISPWRTPAQLFFDKVSPRTPEELEQREREMAGVLRRGKILEPVVRELVIAKLREQGHNVELVNINQRYEDSEHPFLACEIDAELLLDGEPANVEIKTARFRSAEWGKEENSDEIPDYYHAQGLHGLMISKKKLCIFGALFGLDDITLYRIPQHDGIIAGIRAQEINFWTNHVLTGVPPAPSNLDDIKLMFAKAAGQPVEASPEIVEAIEQFRAYKADAANMKEEMDRLEYEIAAHVCREWNAADPIVTKDGKIVLADGVDNAVITFQGQVLATYKKQRGAFLDQKRLKAENPELHADLMREHWFRVLRPSK